MIDFTKPLQTRDGRAVKIYCTDAPGEYPIHGRIEGGTTPACWTASGELCLGDRCPLDLINVPEPKREGWVNVYLTACTDMPFVGTYATREEADKYNVMRIARIHWTEGQFDD